MKSISGSHIHQYIIRKMKSTIPSSLLFIFFLCIIFYAPLPALCTSLYESLCNEYRPEEDIPKCLNLLKNDSKIPLATNYHDLSQYILEKALNEAILIETNYTELVKRFDTDKAISNCAYEFYNAAIGGLKSALNELENDPRSARIDAITAASEVNDCEKALGDTPASVIDPSIRERNNEIYFISLMSSLAIIHLFS